MPAPFVIEGRVSERSYRGDSWDHVVHAAGASLRVTTAPDMSAEPGAAVWLNLDPARLVALP